MSHGLVDHINIYVRGGDGGNGSRSMRREKFVPDGGPDGGDGGRGANVYVQVDGHLHTLLDLKRKVHWRAGAGGKGGRKRASGRDGEDVILLVPPGTIVADKETGLCLADLFRDGERVLVARGGRGGRGNCHFVTSVDKAPRHYENGDPGEERWLTMDLQMMAEVGIVGMPNAGKSTLLSVISRAEPKVGDYPFTTLQPTLGVVNRGYQGIVFADLPGLVEGASQGVGLGHRFLRHVERTRVLLHLLDLASLSMEEPLETYDTLRRELRLYSQNLALRPEVVAVNKCELESCQGVLEALRAACRKRGLRLFEVSCHAHAGLPALLEQLFGELDQTPLPVRQLAHPLPPRTHHEFRVEYEVDCWRVFGEKVELLVRSTDMEDPDNVRNLQRKLLGWGVEDELLRQGAEAGETVRIGKNLFDFEPTPEWLRRERQPDHDAVQVRPSQKEALVRRAELRKSAKEQAQAVAGQVGTRGRGRKKGQL
ncbi:GTPase ObgE [bacterium]|nr:GTPase ObgE [bacterium]